MNVTPFESTGNQADGAIGHTVQLADFYLCGSARQEAANPADRFVGELGATIPFSYEYGDEAHSVGVPDVLDVGHVLKVAESVVALVGVNVIDLGAVRARTNERSHYKVMDGARNAPAAETENDANVSKARCSRSKNAACTGTAAGHIPSDTPSIGHGVDSLESDHWEPNLGGIFGVSHRRTSSRVPVVRLGWGGATPRRAAFIFSQNEVKA